MPDNRPLHKRRRDTEADSSDAEESNERHYEQLSAPHNTNPLVITRLPVPTQGIIVSLIKAQNVVRPKRIYPFRTALDLYGIHSAGDAYLYCSCFIYVGPGCLILGAINHRE